MHCPHCNREIHGQGPTYTCGPCGKKYTLRFSCEACGEKPEETVSCGSVSYFCTSCNELKSRSSMKYEILHEGDSG